MATEQAKKAPRQVAAYQSLRPVMVDASATWGAQIGVNLLLPDGTLGTLAKLQALFGGGTLSDGGSTITTTDDIEEGQWHLWFTDRRAQDAVGGILDNSANVTLAYVGGTSITANLTDLADSGTGALLAVTFDAKGRKTGSRAATITGTVGRVTVADGDAAVGLPTIDLAAVADAGGGALLRFVRDAWGRITGTSAATTSDLTEGSNLYYTTARVLATVLAGLSTATSAVISATDTVLGALGKLQAQVTANLATLTSHTGNTANPHSVTKAQVGLGNVDNTSDVNKPVSTAQQAALDALLPPGYIDGLQMQWVSGTALTITSGSAYIQGSAKVLRAPSAIAKSGLSLTASTWYHVYLYSNAGTPDVEIVTTAPVAAYNGTARSKTGDTSRRYVGSVKTDSSGNIINFLQSGTTVGYVAPVGSGSPPFRILSGGTATSLTTVSASGIIPVTATLVQASFIDTATSGGFLCVSPGNYTGAGGVIVLNHASKMNSLASTDGAQAFVYQYAGASSGGVAYIDVFGYVFER